MMGRWGDGETKEGGQGRQGRQGRQGGISLSCCLLPIAYCLFPNDQ
jgi:hypothetical protein